MNWVDFYPFVLPDVIGCPEPTLDHHIRRAAIDLCRKTLCYTQTLDPLLADGVSNTVSIDTPSATEIVRVMAVTVDGKTFSLAGVQQAHAYVASQFPGEYAFQEDNQNLSIYPLQLAGIVVSVDAALMPTMKATRLDDMFTTYVQDIAYGAVASLAMIPSQAWSNPQLAGHSAGMFRSRCDTLALKISRGRAASKMRNFKQYL